MEGFLSLPRSAKAGLAVLLAVALLGWGIVAYSSKRQHEDTKSLRQALATLDGKAEAEEAFTGELEDARTRLEAAKADLSASMDGKVELEDQISRLEADLGEREKAVADLSNRLAAIGEGAEPGSETQQLGLLGNQESAGPEVDTATLRERLTGARTALSSRSATLAQRDRELKQAQEEYETASARIEGLEADLVEQEVLRERLKNTMTKLSGRSAMLAQRDRDLAKVNEELEALQSQLAIFEADASDRAETDQTLKSFQLRVDRTEQALEEGTEALAINREKIKESESRLTELQIDFNSVKEAIEDKKQEFADREKNLIGLNEKVMVEEEKLAALASTIQQRNNDIEEAKQQLADLGMAKSELEAGISSLTAELEQQEATIANKEDAIAYTDTRLAKLKEEVAMTEERIGETEKQLEGRVKELDERGNEVEAVQATLRALKDERSTTATETVDLRNTINEQQAVLMDLDAAKGDLERTRTELTYQRKLLSERQEQIQLAENRLTVLQDVTRDEASRDRTFARLPIAAISTENPAVLPVDPTYEAFPVQTPIGIRLAQVHFDMGSAELTPSGMRKAKEAAAWIKAQDVEKIRLVGFTDSIGTKANNRALAKRRATSLFRVFEAEGVDPSRIEIVAKGEVGTREATEDHTAEPVNRCVGVFIGADG